MIKARTLQLLYSTLLTLGLPVALLRLLWKSRKNSDYRRRLPERLARRLPQTRQVIWIHAVSVGEFLAVLPLILRLQANQHSLLITTTTPTGSAMVKDKLGDSVQHCYLPFDSPTLVKRFLCCTQPMVAVFVETEIWANYLQALHKQQIPALLINARLSQKSFRGYAKLGDFSRHILACFTEVACQNKPSQRRFQQLGATATLLGNIKFDLTAPKDLSVKQIDLKKMLCNRDFILAASTHKGEESLLLSAYQAQKNKQLLVIAPRHPERHTEVAALCEEKQLNWQRYSDLTCKAPLKDETLVLIVDTLGELLYFYSLADYAIIGGSFTPRGGHNPLEAALFATPCVIGQHYFNFESLINEMVSAQAIIVSSPDSVFTPREDLSAVGKNALDFLAKNQGALERYLELIEANSD